METIASPIEEQRLVRAVEKAATLASVNESLDRNKLLADSLRTEHVDSRFAKTASAAFNKRLTVLLFQHTKDEDRHKPFPLTDADAVYEMLGGEVQQKAASVSCEFHIAFVAPPAMKKTASAEKCVSKLPYEYSVSTETFKQHLESVLDKQASAFGRITGEMESLDSDIKERSEQLAAYFQKTACGSFEFTTLVNLYGKDFEDAMKPYLPKGTRFEKTAAAAVPGNSPAFEKTEELIGLRKLYDGMLGFIGEYADGIREFSKSAAAFATLMDKYERDGMPKQAASPFAAAFGNYVIGPMNTALMVGQELRNFAEDYGSTAGAGLRNALQLYQAGAPGTAAPSDVLDADFLIKDRFRDRLMAWSDMTADPQFSMYPAEQVFNATQKAMNISPSLERPDRRETLRSYVGQLLAQNLRASTADIAALSTTLKQLDEAKGPEAAAAQVSSDKLQKPDAPQLESMFTKLPERKKFEPIPFLQVDDSEWENAEKQTEKLNDQLYNEYLREKDNYAKHLEKENEREFSEYKEDKRQQAAQDAAEKQRKDRQKDLNKQRKTIYKDVDSGKLTQEQAARIIAAMYGNFSRPQRQGQGQGRGQGGGQGGKGGKSPGSK